MKLATFEINSDAQALTMFDRRHKYVINLGGKGSGKTATHPAWAFDRGQWDTGQLHGIFTNTEKQLKEGVFMELFTQLPRAGVEVRYGSKPPKSWFQRWAHADVPIPPLTDYRGVLYTSQGLHALCGTLFNQNFTQYESLQFASLRIEEIPALSKLALTTMITRLRCGMGDDCAVKYGHRHQAHLFGNPPIGPHPWLYDWLDTWEEGAGQLYHALSEGETCDGCWFVSTEGKRIAKTHGPQVDHRQWTLLRQGIGNAVLIKSKTSENRKNLNAGYEDDLAMNFDKATAKAWLGGELVREVSGGCYDSFSDVNVREVGYDPDRALYVSIDINIEPRICVLSQPLRPGEYPDEWFRPRVEFIGVFGEFFSTAGGMSDQRFAEAMMKGERGVGEVGYPDEGLRGLPANWAGLEAHRGPIIFYGDAEGNRRSAHDENLGASWDIIMRVWSRLVDAGGKPRYSRDVPDSNPPARTRIHAVNAKFMSADTETRQGAPSMVIASRCRQTVKDCEMVVWDEKGLAEREWRRGDEANRTHCMAAVGYMVIARAPVDVEPKSSHETMTAALSDVRSQDHGKARKRTLYPRT